MKILVSGSRRWDDRYSLADHLRALVVPALDAGDTVLVIHGDAPGVDTIARNMVRRWTADGWAVAEHAMPARWSECAPHCKPDHRRARASGVATYCPTAGHRRNAQMVALRPDVCIAFIRDASPGATGCANLAEAAGIPTIRITWEDRAEAAGVPTVRIDGREVAR